MCYPIHRGFQFSLSVLEGWFWSRRFDNENNTVISVSDSFIRTVLDKFITIREFMKNVQ